MLELRNLSKSYANGRPVLANLSWTFNAGEFIASMGDSGVGKSTLHALQDRRPAYRGRRSD